MFNSGSRYPILSFVALDAVCDYRFMCLEVFILCSLHWIIHYCGQEPLMFSFTTVHPRHSAVPTMEAGVWCLLNGENIKKSSVILTEKLVACLAHIRGLQWEVVDIWQWGRGSVCGRPCHQKDTTGIRGQGPRTPDSAWATPQCHEQSQVPHNYRPCHRRWCVCVVVGGECP